MEIHQARYENSSLDLCESVIFQLDEIVWSIFSFLGSSELAQSVFVCRKWHQILSDRYWDKHFNPANLIEDFSNYVAKGILTWKKVRLYANLSHLIDRSEKSISGYRFPDETFNSVTPRNRIIQMGPRLLSIDFGEIYLSQGSDKTLILGGKGKNFLNLTVDQDYLYALRDDGLIVQWSLKDHRLVQTLNTNIKIQVCQNRKINFNLNECFYTDGELVLVNHGIFPETKIVIGSLVNSFEEFYLQNEDLENKIAYPKRVFGFNKQVFALDSNRMWRYCKKLRKITQIDLKLFKDNNDEEVIADFSLHGFFLYILTEFNNRIFKMHIVDLRNDRHNEIPMPSVAKILKMECIQNLFFGFGVYQDRFGQRYEFIAVDLNRQELLDRLHSLDFQLKIFKNYSLDWMIPLVKANLSPLNLARKFKDLNVMPFRKIRKILNFLKRIKIFAFS